jgi:hypothetical protein
MSRPIPIEVLAAAEWLANNWSAAFRSPSMVGLLRKQFGLSLDHSIKAIAQAKRLRAGR